MKKSLKFCGDVWAPSGMVIKKPCEKIESLIINLEGPITRSIAAEHKKICLKSDESVFEILFPTPPLAVSLANNHILDYGVEGFKDTINYLDSRNINYFGAGLKNNNCNNPKILDVDGERIALLGYVCKTTHPIFATDNLPGVAPIDLDVMSKDIARSRAMGATRVVLNLHWGEEEVSIPKPDDVRIANEISNMGADIVIGHHAHCMHPVFFGNGIDIYFGLGNAVFPDFEYIFPNGGMAWSKQRSWNKRTMVVDYQPKCNSSSYVVLSSFIDGKCIPEFPALEWETLPLGERYIREYSRLKKYGHMRLSVSRLIAKPRVPSPGKAYKIIKSLIKS